MKKRALGRLAKQRCDVIAVKAKADTVKKIPDKKSGYSYWIPNPLSVYRPIFLVEF
jgi:hypothetical protein